MAGGRPQGSPLRRVTRSALRAGGQGRPPLRKRYKGCGKAGGVEPRPYKIVTRGAGKRADVGSELSAAGGRGSEVSEWPRSKF